MAGGAGAIGAVLALAATPLVPAPTAHADIDDLIFQPFINAFGEAVGVVDPAAGVGDVAGSALATGFADPLESLDAVLAGWYQNLVIDPVHDLEQWVSGGPAVPGAAADSGAATDDSAVGVDADAAGAAAAGDVDVPTSATVPLTVSGGTEPVVDVSVGGGASTPVLVDTGSDGLLIPWQDFNWLDAGFPTNIHVGSFSGGMDYLYTTMSSTVSFSTTDGTDITTAPTPVDVELFAFPTTLQGLLTGDFTLNSFLGGGADGILGIGPNAVGPGPSSPITALPGDLSDGVLIDQPGGQLVFGPDPLTEGTSVSGAPNANLEVSINGGAPQPVAALVDSGGVYGTMPDSLFGGSSVDGEVLKPGTVVSISTADGQPLYSYTVGTDAAGSSTSPTVTSDTTMNTGNIPFEQQPVYISNSPSGQGATIFGATP